MKYITFPSGSKMPVVGLGTYLAKNPSELESALDAALENGYRHFDTAYLYENEEIIGKVLKKWLSGNIVKRDELFITTKLPFTGVHPDRVEIFLDKSLRSLGLDYVDLYLIHFPVCLKYDGKNNFPVDENGFLQTEDTDHIAVWKKLEEMVRCGKVKNIGISNFTQAQISKILQHATIKPANLQIELHVYHQTEELTDFCMKNGISIVAYSPLGSPGINSMNIERGFPLRDLPNLMGDPEIVGMSKKYGKTPAQILIKFLVQKGFAVIPKSITAARIKENIDIFNFEIDTKDMEKLRRLDKGNTKICNMDFFKGIQDHPEFPF